MTYRPAAKTEKQVNSPPSPDTGTWAGLIRHPGYARYFVAVALARVPTTMWAVAVALLVLERTGNLSLVGITVAAGSLPAALTGPLLGAWLDITRSRRVLIALDQLTAIAALVGILLVAGHGPNWALPALGVAYGLTSPLSMGAFRSVLPELVGADLLPKANTMEATSINLAYIVGPAAAGAIAGVAGAATAVEVQIGLFAATIALTITAEVFELRPSARPTAGLMGSVRDGLRALWRIVPLRAVSASSLFSVMGWGTLNVGFPAFAIALGAGAHASGYLWAAVSVGSVVSAFAFAGLANRLSTVALMAGSSVAMACSAMLWPLAGNLSVAIVLVTLTGLLEGPALAAFFTLRQRYTPPQLRGQVFSTVGSLTLAGMAIGSAIAGPVHAALGTDATLMAFAVLQLVSGGCLLTARGELRGIAVHRYVSDTCT
ncbi:MAG: MFS transporter [Solirubrobacterales bacterium]|nr:MFS transporter [Solirubrobacterales bacterium]